jgi:hypothetical protein
VDVNTTGNKRKQADKVQIASGIRKMCIGSQDTQRGARRRRKRRRGRRIRGRRRSGVGFL